MMMRRKGKSLPRVLLVLVILFIGIQVIRPERSNPPVESDMIEAWSPPPAVAAALHRGCYDCHSNQSEWPWYSAIAPFSWLVAGHVEEARHHLNFSQWASYTEPAAVHKLEEAVEEVEGGEMPLKSYALVHRDAPWSAEELEALKTWVAERKSRLAPGESVEAEDQEHSEHE